MGRRSYTAAAVAALTILLGAQVAHAWADIDVSARCDDNYKVKWTVKTDGTDDGGIQVTLSPGGQSTTVDHSNKTESSGTFDGQPGRSYTVKAAWKGDESVSDSVSVTCKDEPTAGCVGLDPFVKLWG